MKLFKTLAKEDENGKIIPYWNENAVCESHGSACGGYFGESKIETLSNKYSLCEISCAYGRKECLEIYKSQIKRG